MRFSAWRFTCCPLLVRRVPLRVLFRQINLWVIGGAICVALVLLAVTFGTLWWTRSAGKASFQATAVFNVIPYPTFTPTPLTLTATPTLDPTTDSLIPPAPAPGIIIEGALVQISGTGGDGLRLRSIPGLDSKVLFLALEAEVFRVQDGPVEQDGYSWWYLVAPYDSTIGGWGVSNYMIVVQNP